MAFDSQLEADASILLADVGITPAPGLLPATFYDANNAPFKARADFIHAPTGVLFELKHSHLNGTGSQAAASNKRRSSRSRGSAAFRQVTEDWNHSAAKLDLVQRGIASAGSALVCLFWHEPDADTVTRLSKRGTFWTVYGSPSWRSLLGFLKLRAHGVPCRLSYADAHVFH